MILCWFSEKYKVFCIALGVFMLDL